MPFGVFLDKFFSMERLSDILFSGSQTEFLLEIFIRTFIMFLLVLLVLRLLGRRGVRQLTLFEMAMIISLGSAAGDPMFQDDLPISYAVIVFMTVVILYKGITWIVMKYRPMEKMLEGTALTVVQDGMFALEEDRDLTFSKMEFFSELRNLSVEHLGQVREGVLEVDGTLSVLFYEPSQVRFGLPLFPSRYREISGYHGPGPFACMFCGKVIKEIPIGKECPRCSRNRWALAMNTQRV